MRCFYVQHGARALRRRLLSEASLARCGAPSASVGVIAANIYVSEGRDHTLLALLEAAASPACVHRFVDAEYHRTGFTLASGNDDKLHDALLRLAAAAVSRLDLRSHVASHPRLGVMDHVSLHWLGEQAPHEAERVNALALRVAASLAAPPLGLPVHLYGGASSSGRPLEGVRRALGYFSGTGVDASHPPPPDFGPHAASPSTGLVCLGSLPWVVNFNSAVQLRDFPQASPATEGARDALLPRAQRVARALSQRRGGPPGVQSLALAHGDGSVEVACNLLTPAAPAVDQVRTLLRDLAAREGLTVTGDYCTGAEPEDIRKRVLEMERNG